VKERHTHCYARTPGERDSDTVIIVSPKDGKEGWGGMGIDFATHVTGINLSFITRKLLGFKRAAMQAAREAGGC